MYEIKLKLMLDNYLNHFFKGRISNKPNKESKVKPIRTLGEIKDILKKRDTRMVQLDIDGELPSDAPQPIKDIFNKIKTMKMLGKLDDMKPEQIEDLISNQLNDALGVPIKSDKIKTDKFTVHRSVWKTNKLTERTLANVAKELEKAIEVEDYELAVRLREEMRELQSIENEGNDKKDEK